MTKHACQTKRIGRWPWLVVGVVLAGCATPPSKPVAPRAPVGVARAAPVATVDADPPEATAEVTVAPGLDDLHPYPSIPRVPVHVKGPPRPQFSDAVHVRYADLPLFEEAPLQKDDDESFWLVLVDKTSKSCGQSEPRMRFTWRFSRTWRTDAVIRVDDLLLPPKEVLDGEYESAELYGKIVLTPYTANPTSTHISLVSDVEWVTLDRAGLTRDTAPIAHYEGRFADMSGHARTVRRGTARALLPGQIYAFRECRSHCDEPLGSPSREEELFVVGPPSEWYGASGDVVRSTGERQKFTFLKAKVRPGTSANVLLDVSSGDVGTLAAPDVVPGFATAFEVDVVWPEGEEADLEVFSGSIIGPPEQIHEDRRQTYPPGGPCLF